MSPNRRPDDRQTVSRRVLDGFEELMHRLMATHAPELVETSMTMSQVKALYLVGATEHVSLSELAARLGVSASTASEAVDRLVDAGQLARADDPTDRRQVVLTLTPDGAATLDRMRELNSRQLKTL